MRRPSALVLALALVGSLLAPGAALADHVGDPSSVTLAGDLQSELGCDGDWLPDCAATHLADDDGDGIWTATFAVPAGDWLYKVALDDAWDVNFGADGTQGGADIPLSVSADGNVTFSYDHTTHQVTAAVDDDGDGGGGDGLERGDLDLVRPSLREDLTDEVFYFVLPDRFFNGDAGNDTGGFGDDRLENGFDPTDRGFFHGGDLAGLLEKMDYLEGLGVTAIWMAPVFKNQPVQGLGTDFVSAGYHGYWTVDYTQIDPHFGTNDELTQLIDEAHSRDIKVFFDIITNHTADVIRYAEDVYEYVPKADAPYRDAEGDAFDDRDYAGSDEFPELDTEASFPYTPVIPEDAPTKFPAWLNDPTLYHNRGDSTFAGESSVYGDFVGLDDLFTEHPEVVEGMIDIFEPWVSMGVDGFRIDTVKHVNIEFWQEWVPAILDHARSEVDNPDFFMFGEVFDADPAYLSIFTTKGELQSTLDFGFQSVAQAFAANSAPTERLQDFFAADDWYIDDDSNAYSLPTFLGNHDMGRIGMFIRDANPDADDDELLARDTLAHALMYTARGMPVIYSGDEQGFTGEGNDQLARQDMFPSLTEEYWDDEQIGTDATPQDDSFDTSHPLYERLGDLAALIDDHAALRSGAQLHRYASDAAGILAFSRVDRDERVEHLVVANNAESEQTATFATGTPDTTFTPLWPADAEPVSSGADGTVELTAPGLGLTVYRAEDALPASESAPDVAVAHTDSIDLDKNGHTRESLVFTATLDRDLYAEVTFATSIDGGEWTYAGTDDHAPYRIAVDTEDLEAGTEVRVKAIVDDLHDHYDAATATAQVDEEPPPPPAGLQEHAVVHFPATDDVDDLSVCVSGDVAPSVLAEQTLPDDCLAWNGEDDYGVFRYIRLDTSDGRNDQVGFSIGGDDERSIDPSTNPEVWVSPDTEDVFFSQAAAQGFATVHYQRPDGQYDGWGLHLWGDGLADGVATEWESPRPPDGTDEFGVFWEVPISDATQPLNYVIHAGEEKDPGPDQSFVPAEQPHAYVVSGDETIHRSRAAAEDLAVLHYHRDDGAYGDPDSDDFNDVWGLHVWEGAATPTEWTDPIRPTATDRFGVVFEVPLADGANALSYIIHRGEAKDLPEDQRLELGTYGHEVWIDSGREGYVLPIVDTGPGPEPGDLGEARAHWLTEDLIAWDVDAADASYTLHVAADGGLELEPGGVAGGDDVALEWVDDTLPDDLADQWPHLAGYAALRVPDELDVGDAVKGAVAVSAAADGRRIDATGLQIPGVLDDLYAGAARDAHLGVTWDAGTPTLRLWAPTARSVTLHLFDDSATEPPGDTVEMTLDPVSGVWSATGEPGWDRRYYLYEVEVYVPSTGQVEENVVTDPYSVSLATNSEKSQIVDLSDADLQPEGWQGTGTQAPATPEQIDLYELHVRDFSITDESVPEEHRGTYMAFTHGDSDGMRHLRDLQEAGLTTVHLLPTFDIATIEERRSEQVEPDIPADAGPASTEQQEAVLEVAGSDGFNWGYDPFHYTTPEGSYATDPDGVQRIVEYRRMVQALNDTGLGVVNDVVYNHTAQSGQGEKSVLDKVVPGYYHRLLEDGSIATSTCCENTATEHAMMGKLMVDSVVTWATAYKVDGFRFDLMGHHSKANMLAVRSALDALTPEEHGVDGSQIYVYGEGWNFGEVENDARFEQATQLNMGGTGIGTFNDRLRDAVRGGGPFDDNPRVQGFGSGGYTDPNDDPINGDDAAQRARLLHNMDQIRVGLAGNLADYAFTDRNGETVTGAQVDYNGSPTGYTQDPQENILYVSAHDNETLFDSNAFKLPQDTSMSDRVRMQQVALSTVALGQGVSFFHAGGEILRSKSLDRNSYDSGDHFNVLDWSYQTNNFGVGLPPAPDNEAKWPYMEPLLADPDLRPSSEDIQASAARFRDLLAVADSSPLFTLTTAEQVRQKVAFLNTGPDQVPGVIAMHLDDTVGEGVDDRLDGIVVVFNASPDEQSIDADAMAGADVQLSSVQQGGADSAVKDATFDPTHGTFTVPARTTAVFEVLEAGTRPVASVERVAGDDRVETAIAVSAREFPDGADEAVIARADAYPDALAGGPLAAALSGPVLLTGGDGLDPRVAAELERLGPQRITLLGGSAALSLQVAVDAAEHADVRRLAGANRFATAARIAEELGPDPDDVYLVEGIHREPHRGWPDAVSVSALASRDGAPILLTSRDHAPDATRTAICAIGADVTVVGGTAAVSDDVVAQATDCDGGGVDLRARLAGADRYATSAAVAEAMLSTSDADAASSDMWLATGRAYPDALTAGPAAASDAGVLLVDGAAAQVPDVITRLLAGPDPAPSGFLLVGGEDAISAEFEDALVEVTTPDGPG